MRVYRLFIFLSFWILVIGCSSNGTDPVNPVKPDSDNPWRDASAIGGGNVTSDNYWNDTVIVRDKVWVAHRNPNGTVHYALGSGIDVSSNPIDVIAEFPNLFTLSSNDFCVFSDEEHAGLRIVILRQYYNDLRVWPSLVELVYGRGGKLIKAMADVFPIGEMSTNPNITESQAISAVFNDIGNTELESSNLVIYATWDACYLAYRVKTQDWIHFINASDGSVLNREHLMWEGVYEGQVHGLASQPNWYDPQETYNFSNLELRIRIDPEESYPTSYLPLTDRDGLYSFKSDQDQLEAELRFFGPWMNSNNMQNYPYNELSMKRDIFADQSEDWFLDDTNSLRDERTVWFWSNYTWDYLKDIDPTGHEMDFQLMANVHNNAWCNAMASGRSINFYQESSGCLNLGEIPDVIVHEWGHVHQYEQYGDDLPDTSMREGNADVIANTVCDHPYIGWNAQGEGTYFRLSDNELMWPLDECGGEGHCLGRLVAGAFWDLREIVGRDYHDYLWHFSKYLLGQTFQDWGADVVIIDDDDDDPLNGSPNYQTIYTCWETNHNLDIPDAVDIPTSGLVIDVVPSNPQIRIDMAEPNKHFQYHLKIMNLDDVPNMTQIWAAVELPWSAMYGPIIPSDYRKSWPFTIQVMENQTLEFDLSQNIPIFAPVGEYKYHIRIGQYVDNVNDVLTDDARFSFWIID
jgi:hypothetical protein